MNLLSIIMYTCLLLPLHLKAMEQYGFKNQLFSTRTYYPITSQTYSSYVYKPAPKKAPSASIKNEQTKARIKQKTY